MGRNKQPVDLVIARGKKHLSKAEIEKRRNEEVVVGKDKIQAPDYLSESLKARFDEIADELIEVGIMTNLDCEALARYVVQEDTYRKITKVLIRMGANNEKYALTLNQQSKAFDLVRKSASDLGLTITSRAKLIVPKTEKKEDPIALKFGNI